MASFSNPMWDEALKPIVLQVVQSLGMDQSNVGYVLDKVVLDDIKNCRRSNDHNSQHIGSLEIQLPSIFKGGSHMMRHDGMKSVFSMGADDSSCTFDCWFLARYADCEHKTQAITEGCRLVVMYSLVWKGAGPPPGAPAMKQVKQLVRTLRRSAGYAGLYLEGAKPDVLGRHGFSGLPPTSWGRLAVGLLQAASAHMAQGREPDHLVLHICKASLIEEDGELGLARLDLDRRIYCPDGSEPSPAARTVLSAFRFPEDMPKPEVTVASDADSGSGLEYDSCHNAQGINIMSGWWSNADPASEYDRGYTYQVPPAYRAQRTPGTRAGPQAMRGRFPRAAMGKGGLRE